jgi:hypothetical protein
MGFIGLFSYMHITCSDHTYTLTSCLMVKNSVFPPKIRNKTRMLTLPILIQHSMGEKNSLTYWSFLCFPTFEPAASLETGGDLRDRAPGTALGMEAA